MLRTQRLDDLDFTLEDTWPDLLASVAYAVRSTVHTTLGASPAQLIYGRDMILPLQYVSEWDLIVKNKQNLIDKSNVRENKSRIDWDYNVGDLVLVTSTDIERKLDCPTQGPFAITQVHTNGTVRIQRGAVSERVNIRRCMPFRSQDSMDARSSMGASAISGL